ncbi:MAG: sensor histidine kinase N-terminal domain-containing protein [Pseudomonadota bacterium]
MPTAPAKPSLRSRVVRNVLIPLALTWLAGTLVTLVLANSFMQQAFDRALLDDAHVVAANVKLQSGVLQLGLSQREISTVLFDQVESEYFAVLLPDGTLVAGEPALALPDRGPRTALHGFSDLVVNGSKVRAATLHLDLPVPFDVVVAETTRSRTAQLQRLLAWCIAPQTVFLFLLAWWLRRSITRDLQPLAQLQQAVQLRDANDLTPVPVNASTRDIEKLGLAVNSLLARLNESGRALREFTGNVAHELRTPLAGIRALAEYGLAHREPAVWQAQLQGIVSSQARASRLVDQLLALALADEAKAGIQLATVALDGMVQDSVMRFLAQADAAGVDLGARGMDGAARVTGDATLIEGILNNLLDNALRYGRNDRGEPSSVTVALSHTGGGVTLSVIDNGPGLSPQMRSRLTQRWMQGSAGQMLGLGAGLGLAIVAQYAQLMNARFELGDGADGHGLAASVTFPGALNI